jgi:hypothetical protein
LQLSNAYTLRRVYSEEKEEETMEAEIKKTEDILGRRGAAKLGSRGSKLGSLPIVLTMMGGGKRVHSIRLFEQEQCDRVVLTLGG